MYHVTCLGTVRVETERNVRFLNVFFISFVIHHFCNGMEEVFSGRRVEPKNRQSHGLERFLR